MTILGIHQGHDSSVALIRDGLIQYAMQEERLVEIKHSMQLPVQALDACLKATKCSIRDIEYIAVPGLSDTPEIYALFGTGPAAKIDVSSQSGMVSELLLKSAIKGVGFLNRLSIGNQFGFPVYVTTHPVRKKTKLVQVNHHLAHAAAAYYTSGFRDTLVVTSDGSGDGLSMTLWDVRSGSFQPLVKIGRNGSLGLFYNIVTEALGWQASEGEGKVMGLAPYGSTEKTSGALDFITPRYRDGKLIEPKWFGFPSHFKTGGHYHWHFRQADRVKVLSSRFGREAIAAEAQQVLEREMLNFLVPWIRKTGHTHLAAAGGVFLNVKLNQAIWEAGNLEDFFIFPDAGDGGLSIGAALYVNAMYGRPGMTPARIDACYWGERFSDAEVSQTLEIRKIPYTRYEDRNRLISAIAAELANGKIVGWFQGQMEAGPRALGNRSILMDPRNAENKDIINARVKYREAFRPFCPSMTPAGAKRYLQNPTKHAPFMIISFTVPEDVRHEIAAVVHVDGTTRPQVVTRKANPLYHDLISAFGVITGVPVLLNTSFNIRGTPMVATPSQAVRCFFDTGMDVLVMGRYVIEKRRVRS